VSPDNESVYVTGFANDAVGIFDRTLATGVLTQKTGTLGCISSNATTITNDNCQAGRALTGAWSITVSPDDNQVYVSTNYSSTEAISIFDRDLITGELTQKAGSAGCISSDPTTIASGCQSARAMSEMPAVVVSPDGNNVYAASR
jgi:DNA-binding beta-propeller fold protein YncE